MTAPTKGYMVRCKSTGQWHGGSGKGSAKIWFKAGFCKNALHSLVTRRLNLYGYYEVVEIDLTTGQVGAPIDAPDFIANH